jgi:hypothetical protein
VSKEWRRGKCGKENSQDYLLLTIGQMDFAVECCLRVQDLFPEMHNQSCKSLKQRSNCLKRLLISARGLYLFHTALLLNPLAALVPDSLSDPSTSHSFTTPQTTTHGRSSQLCRTTCTGWAGIHPRILLLRCSLLSRMSLMQLQQLHSNPCRLRCKSDVFLYIFFISVECNAQRLDGL